MPTWSVLNHQNGLSPLMENLSFFHDHIMIILILVLTITILIGILTTTIGNFSRIIKERQEMEIFWSSLPTIILFIVASPSLKLLYLLEEPMEPCIRVKVIGHQWYWSYEYSDYNHLVFDSFLSIEYPRNMITTNQLILPSLSPIRFLVTSTDVIHSWAIPSIGAKIDAVPGRINQFNLLVSKTGLISGQCSEICGIKHRFIPITISSIPLNEFKTSIKNSYS